MRICNIKLFIVDTNFFSKQNFINLYSASRYLTIALKIVQRKRAIIVKVLHPNLVKLI